MPQVLEVAGLVGMRGKREDHFLVAPAVILNVGQHAPAPRRPHRRTVKRLRPQPVIQVTKGRPRIDLVKKRRQRLRDRFASASVARPVVTAPEKRPYRHVRTRLWY